MRWRAVLLGALLAVGSFALSAAEIDEAAFVQRLAEMREPLGEEFIVEREGIFLIASDLPREQFDRIRTFTIRRSARAMWRAYFDARPAAPIAIYLFRDGRSYRRWAKTLFGDAEVPHFGYYRPASRTMVMNIATGTGTLVHEMTHALMRPDFPDVPTWLDEGLASLHEQCQVREDTIIGLENWRLPALQEAIRDDKLVPLDTLVGMREAKFRGEGVGLHYAEARYLVMYLQHKGLLRRFYRAFRDGRDDDPAGAKTLAAVTCRPLETLQREWVRWVQRLRFPPR
jgi:hypothetical protein